MATQKNSKNVKSRARKEEFLGLMLIVLGILVLLSLVSYHAEDWPNSSVRFPVKNWMGLAGAWLAFYLYNYTIGYPMIVLPFLMMYWGWSLIKKNPLLLVLRRSGYVLFFALVFSVAFALPGTIQHSGRLSHEFNGLVGLFFAQVLHQYLGSIGSVIILFTVLLGAFLSLTEVSVADLLLRFGDEVREMWGRWMDALATFRHRQKLRKSLREKQKERAVGGAKPVPPPRAANDFGIEPGLGQEVDQPVPEPETEPPVEEEEIQPEPPIDLAEEPVPSGPESAGKTEETREPERPSTPARAEVTEEPPDYQLPPLELLNFPPPVNREHRRAMLMREARSLEEKLAIYGIRAKVVNIHPGPLITQFEVEPAAGVKISKFFSIVDDLAMVMRAKQIRILAPIPGKSVVGIEIPNREPEIIYFRQVVDTEKFRSTDYRVPIALGVDTTGRVHIADLTRMPHVLVGGATNMGKSVCLNAIIASLLYRFSPSDLRLILIDPKKLEFTVYSDLRNHHLITLPELNEEVVTTPENAIQILNRLILEMERRFNELAKVGVRTLEEYNDRLAKGELQERYPDRHLEKIPYIVLIIDELADLILVSKNEIEEPISRLAHKARAVGIHLIVATQRPSTDVITGAIKANFPSRIAFKTSSKVDSRVILDFPGADRLLGRGDMLFLAPTLSHPIRLHGPWITTDEISAVINYVSRQPAFPPYKLPEIAAETAALGVGGAVNGAQMRDPLFNEALKLVVRHQQGSISLLQRRLRVGYARAARLIDELEQAGFVGAYDGSKAREVLVTEEDLEEMGLL